MYIISSDIDDYERYTLTLTCKIINKMLKSRNKVVYFQIISMK